MAIQKRPYELSVWSEELFEEGQKKETKMLIIGAHDMTYDGRAISIKLFRKVNGTNTLTFQMLNSFFDSQKGKMVYNDFIDELFAERKIKLHYKDKWWEFYIKSVKEEKKHNSVLKTFSCQDAFIDELARNGYGITFDEELYNNVEEIGTFTEEVLEDSIWEYAPEYNWGDFTEYTEEKLFRIKISNFLNNEIRAYKLKYYYDDFEGIIKNTNTKKERNIELSDDLAREKGYYWDQYDKKDSNGQTQSIHKLKGEQIILKGNDYEYIYIPYSCLDFCYINYDGNGTVPSEDIRPNRTATETPATDLTGKYYVAPTGVNPNNLIQFIAFKPNDKIEIDETGLIIDKKYHYFMTLQDWNTFINKNTWYIFNDKRFVETIAEKENENIYSMSYTYKYIFNGTPARQDLGNKCLTYDGYLSGLNNIEIIKGKKISIADRNEINISKDIDSFVIVYNQQSDDENLINCYSNEEWQGDFSNYRVCSRSSTRQILPILAKNYAENATNIESTTGWEIMYKSKTGYIIEPNIKYRIVKYIDDNGEEQTKITNSYIAFLTGEDQDSIVRPEESDDGIKYWSKEDVENSDWEWLRIRIPMEVPDFIPRTVYYDMTTVEPPFWESPYNSLTTRVNPTFVKVATETWGNDLWHGMNYLSEHGNWDNFPAEDESTPLASYYKNHYNQPARNNGKLTWLELLSGYNHGFTRYVYEYKKFEWLEYSLFSYRADKQYTTYSDFIINKNLQYFLGEDKTYFYDFPVIKNFEHLEKYEDDKYYRILSKIENLIYSPEIENNPQIQIHAGAQIPRYEWTEEDESRAKYDQRYYHANKYNDATVHLSINPELEINDYSDEALKSFGYDLPMVGVAGKVKPPDKNGTPFNYITYRTEFNYLFLKKENNDTVTFYIRYPEYKQEQNTVVLSYVPLYKNVPIDRAREAIEVIEGYCSAQISEQYDGNNPTEFKRFDDKYKIFDDNGNFVEIDKDHNGTITFNTLQDEYNTGGAGEFYLERKIWHLTDDVNAIVACNENIKPYDMLHPSGKIIFQFFNTPQDYQSYESIDPVVDPDEEQSFIPDDETNTNDNEDKVASHTIINFGAVSQDKMIKANKVYCLGLKIKIKKKNANSIIDQFNNEDFVIKIAEGSLQAGGRYRLNNKRKISFTLKDFFNNDYNNNNFLTTNPQPWKYFYEKSSNKEFQENTTGLYSYEYSSLETKYILFKTDFDIESPYITITSIHDYLLEELQIFEAYTKGKDYFNNGYFQLSGRDYYMRINDTSDIKREIKYLISKDADPTQDENWVKVGMLYIQNTFEKSEPDIHNRVLFENDIMAGDVYSYEKYFIQQLYLKNQNKTYDTFKAKSYLDENGNIDSLPLNSAVYNEDDYQIITNEIDLSLCHFYRYEDNGCQHTEGICYYQKYGFCPYLFETEKHCRKIRTLKGEKSNRFNLTQELSKVFKCYPVYYIDHEPNGIIKKDENGKMIKKVYYITEKGSENIYGFRYEKNLSDITRNIVSDKIVTKLYVNDVDSEYSKTGLCSIKTAEDNPSKDSFIINLSYYATKNMLPAAQLEADLYGIQREDGALNGYLKVLGYYNSEYDKLSNKIINLQNNSFNDINAHLQINFEGLNVIIKELKEYEDALAKYINQKESSIYKNYLIKKREAEAKFNNLLEQTFEPAKAYNVSIEDFYYELWFNNLILDYEDRNISGIEKVLNTMKNEHTWEYGLLGQYNKEYLQIKEWEKLRSKYLQLANELTLKFFRKYEPFLKEGTWSDTNYLTDNAYYHGALDVSAQGAIPKVEYSISVIDLSPFEGYKDYELDNADTTYIEDVSILGYNKITGFPNRLKVIISEISEELDIPTKNTIKVQNFTTQFEDLFQQVTATVQNLTLNENIYRRASNFTSLHDIKEESLQNTLNNNSFTLIDSQQKNIVVDQTGQSGSNVNNRTSQYKLTGEGLYFSSDGGVSWKKGATPDQKTEISIKSETIETERINLINNQNKVDTVLSSSGLECCSQSLSTDEMNTFSYNNNGIQYLVNNLKLLQFGTLINDITSNYYGLKVKKGDTDIFGVTVSLNSDEASSIIANSDYSFTGNGIFNGKVNFKNNEYNISLGGAEIGSSISLSKDGKTYTLKLFSITKDNNNILTAFANNTIIAGGTFASYDMNEHLDYIYIENGRTL